MSVDYKIKSIAIAQEKIANSENMSTNTHSQSQIIDALIAKGETGRFVAEKFKQLSTDSYNLAFGVA